MADTIRKESGGPTEGEPAKHHAAVVSQNIPLWQVQCSEHLDTTKHDTCRYRLYLGLVNGYVAYISDF